MLIDLTEGEIIVIRDALREWRTAAPGHIATDSRKLERWREYRALYDGERATADTKMTDALAEMFDARNRLRPELVAPRLQLRWAPTAPNDRAYPWECHYELVMPLREIDIRRDVYNEDGEKIGEVSELVVELKPPTRRYSDMTPCQAQDGSCYYDEPYRDGAHAQWDAEALGGLPIYVIATNGEAFKRP